jgi:hypothetical protein
MRWHEMDYRLEQIRRIRERLDMPTGDIRDAKPVRYASGRLMEPDRLQALVKRCQKHEKRVANIIETQVQIDFNRIYRVP